MVIVNPCYIVLVLHVLIVECVVYFYFYFFTSDIQTPCWDL